MVVTWWIVFFFCSAEVSLMQSGLIKLQFPYITETLLSNLSPGFMNDEPPCGGNCEGANVI